MSPGELRETIRRLLDEHDGDWSAALPDLADWLRPRLRSPESFAALERDLETTVGPTLRRLTDEVLDQAGGDPEAISRFLHERLDPRENPATAASVHRERHRAVLVKVWRLVRSEAAQRAKRP